jgi:hypothetical protein
MRRARCITPPGKRKRRALDGINPARAASIGGTHPAYLRARLTTAAEYSPEQSKQAARVIANGRSAVGTARNAVTNFQPRSSQPSQRRPGIRPETGTDSETEAVRYATSADRGSSDPLSLMPTSMAEATCFLKAGKRTFRGPLRGL